MVVLGLFVFKDIYGFIDLVNFFGFGGGSGSGKGGFGGGKLEVVISGIMIFNGRMEFDGKDGI